MSSHYLFNGFFAHVWIDTERLFVPGQCEESTTKIDAYEIESHNVKLDYENR